MFTQSYERNRGSTTARLGLLSAFGIRQVLAAVFGSMHYIDAAQTGLWHWILQLALYIRVTTKARLMLTRKRPWQLFVCKTLPQSHEPNVQWSYRRRRVFWVRKLDALLLQLRCCKACQTLVDALFRFCNAAILLPHVDILCPRASTVSCFSSGLSQSDLVHGAVVLCSCVVACVAAFTEHTNVPDIS